MMNMKQITEWLVPLTANLKIMRGVTNLNTATIAAIAEQLTRRGFTTAHADVAEAWLLFGDWEQTFRRNKDIYLNDFIPSRAQFESIRDLDKVIHSAALKMIPRIIKNDYIHRTRAKEYIETEIGIILSERAKAQIPVEVDATKTELMEQLTESAEKIRLLRECLQQTLELLESKDVKNVFFEKETHHLRLYKLILFKSHRQLQFFRTNDDANSIENYDTNTQEQVSTPTQEGVLV